MARSINNVILSHGQFNPRPRVETDNLMGKNVCSFSLALNRSYRNQSGWMARSNRLCRHRCVGGISRESIPVSTKGRRCLVQGRLQSRSWEQDGQNAIKSKSLPAMWLFLTVAPARQWWSTSNSNRRAPQSAKPKPSKPTDEVVMIT